MAPSSTGFKSLPLSRPMEINSFRIETSNKLRRLDSVPTTMTVADELPGRMIV